MDPHYSQRNQLNSGGTEPDPSGASANDPPPGQVDRRAADSGNPDRQPRHSDGFTVIPPNESRRSKMKMMAQKEEEDLQRWKEAHRVPAVHLNPERLGGNVTLAEAREKQLTGSRYSKLQKKLQKEELDKRRRQEEEEELQKKKAQQREKAERLAERRQQEDQRREEQLGQDHLRRTERFLQRLERSAPGPPASGGASHASSTSEDVKSKRREGESKSVKEVQLDHKRVNSAFLDRLEGRGRASDDETEKEAERPRSANEDEARPDPDPERSGPDWTGEADPEPDFDWALMKLMSSFPNCSKGFLEDILDQCNGDDEQAYALLIS